MSDKKYVHLPLFDENGFALPEYLKVDARYFITGPARYRTEVVEHKDTVQLVDVNSLFPEAVAIDRALYESKIIDFIRIPEFLNYEVNSDGVVRNFWTKRVLSFGTDPTHTVELHGPDGSPMQMSIAEIMKATFGK